MKTIVSIFISVVFLLTFASCDEGFEELNEDPNSVGQLEPDVKLTNTLLRTAGDRFENLRGNIFYCATMIQHMAAVDGAYAGDKYTYNADASGSWFERGYPAMVGPVEDLLFQLQTNEEGRYSREMLAITRILRVVIYHRFTDLYGDVPYSEAGKGFISGIIRPKYDLQSEVYADMLQELAEATADLGTGDSQFGSADILFKGDQGKWKRFGYSMMLRLGLRLIKVDPAASQQWVQRAIAGGVMNSNDDIAYIEHTAGDGVNQNGNGQGFTAEEGMRLSDTFVNALSGDPRLRIYAALPDGDGDRNTSGSNDPALQQGLANGLAAVPDINQFSEPNRNLITGETDPYFFQSYAEVEFMLAEADIRWGIAGGNPAAHYEAGVSAAMRQMDLYDIGSESVTDIEITDFLATNPYDAPNGLEQVNTQYWIVTFFNHIESYANWRRTGLPILTPVNFDGNESNGQIPRRLRYYEREITRNAENYQDALTRQGPDEFTTRMWWDIE
ncbi:SusD/RagB family nutrient-binding outer membrane lipoprotein [Aquimarina sp. RZ0]|uniref:SusD/RagB family nutrient-binding outer membrane lipoprotein n=1 Tax=Aquimarina sp. RZ0 TaxID=2607730 RepID=UPI0011F0BB3C|nr:SusD/RagB family nutrient-binding outer membrane lipoprotein [Aquimarina sp. RZ0]KAA1243024.1 SusD/RagB family nutrient-binding outer membrane lipoprotein [Aquimarina sp. RZ0]